MIERQMSQMALTVVLLAVIFAMTDSEAMGARIRDTFRLGQVKFEGVKRLSKKELSRQLVARTPPTWRFWAEEPEVTRQDLEGDLLRIRQFYRSKGYYHTECTYEIQTTKGQPIAADGDGKATEPKETEIPTVSVLFTIDEGPPVVIERIDLTLGETDPLRFRITRETLYEEMPLRTGRVFEVESYNETKRWLLRYLGNRGYPMAELESQAKVNTSRNRANVSLALNPGPMCRFGGLSISGNDGYVKRPIIEQAMAFEPGEIYSRRKLDISQRNLFNLQVFSVVRITPGKPEPGKTEVPIRIQIQPREKRKVLAGVGYGTEDGIRVKGGITYRNLSGWADRISLTAKRSDLVRSVQGEYDLPFFFDPKNAFSATAGVEEELLETYENRKTFATTTVTRYLSQRWTTQLGYNLEANDVEDLDIASREARQVGVSEDNYFISSVLSGISRNTTDNDIDPTRGSLSTLRLEAASGLLASEVSYLQPTFRVSAYHRLFEGLVAAGRLRLRAIHETEDTHDIPVFKRLFLGGSNSVRGYGYEKLGPVDEDGTPIGGLSALDANIELRFPLYKKFSGVVFLDMGLVDKTSFRYKLDDMRYSCGAGLRYHTIIGPIRADFGYKLNPPSKRDFGEPTHPDEDVEDRWKIHLSVGHAF